MLEIDDVTLIGIEGIEPERLRFPVDVSRHYCQFGDERILTPQGLDDPYAVVIPPMDLGGYNIFVLRELHRYVDTSHALLIQHDGFILNPDAWTDEFLEYDYIGAPFPFRDRHNVGNGGFCLRSKKFLEATARVVDGPPWVPEDRIICRRYRKALESEGIRFAPVELARRFSLDGNPVEGYVWAGQFGFHNFRTTDLSRWSPPLEEVNGMYTLKQLWELQRNHTRFLSTLWKREKSLRREVKRLSREVATMRTMLQAAGLD
jgi:Protein of unknown function (DUF5672)